MYSKAAQYQAYNLATQTVSKTRQIVMLYDGAINFIRQAKEAIADNRIEDRFHRITRASEILSGLANSLDFDNGGDIAKVLYDYYTMIDFRLIRINMTNDVEECDRIMEELKKMRDVWEDIDINGTEKPAEADSSEESAPKSFEPAEKPESSAQESVEDESDDAATAQQPAAPAPSGGVTISV